MSVDILLKDIEWDGVNKIRVPLEGGGTQDFTIGGGVTPTGNIDITQSGVTDVTNYATATVPQGDPWVMMANTTFYTSGGQRKWKTYPKVEVSVSDGDTAGFIGDGFSKLGDPFDTYALASGTTITPTTNSQVIGGSNVMMEGAVTVNPIPSQYIVPSGTTTLTSNTITGLGYLVKNYERAVVNVCIEFSVANDYTVLCNRTWQGCYDAITDDAYDIIVKYNGVTYGGSAYGFDTNTGELHFVVFETPSNGVCSPLFDIYYPYTGDPYYVSPSHILGTEGTPTATKGAVNNHAIAVTPSVTNSGGFISGGTHTGTAVNITAGELVSGSETKTTNGTYDVSNLATLVVDVNPNLQTKTKTYTPSSYQQEEIISADNGYDGLLAVAVTVERVAGLTLPVGPSLSYTGTRKAKIYQSNSTQYWNIGVGYHNSAEYYEVPPLLVDTKNITQNGTYNAIDDDLDGYSSVTVNVSPTLVNYAIRPDATLVQKYTYDKYMHADENITIPSYSTSAQTIKAGATIGTITLDRDNYFYYVVERMLTIPTYSITTKGKGRCEYHMGVHVYEVIDIPGSTIHALVDTSKYYTTRLNAVSTASASYREVYYSGSSTLTTVSTQAYGTCQAAMAPSISSGVLTINSPTVTERGSTSYFTSTYANAVTDIRAQYVIEVYKAPKNNLNIEGWSHQQSIQQIIDCANSANHKLT